MDGLEYLSSLDCVILFSLLTSSKFIIFVLTITKCHQNYKYIALFLIFNIRRHSKYKKYVKNLSKKKLKEYWKTIKRLFYNQGLKNNLATF